MIVILFLISLVFNIILLFGIFNILKQNEKFEDAIVDWQKKLQEARDTMEDVDLRGAFEADDEVGTTFQILKDIIDSIELLIEQE